MMNNIHIAVDLAKNVFQIAECNASGKIISRKRLNRTQFQCYLAEPRENAIIIMRNSPPLGANRASGRSSRRAVTCTLCQTVSPTQQDRSQRQRSYPECIPRRRLNAGTGQDSCPAADPTIALPARDVEEQPQSAH